MAGATLEERAPAKINLDLRVLGRRPDGHHELDSVVVFADLADFLSFEDAPDLRLTVGGPEADGLGTGPGNLVLRAARALRELAGVDRGARITLLKEIPVAAGLGGGSADAAATLRGLARLWKLDIGSDHLHRLGEKIGADVPVCLASRSVRMRGVGERLTPVPLDPLDLVLVNPRAPVPTGPVFSALAAPPFEGAEGGFEEDPGARWRHGKNDLEAPACRIAPVIGEVLERLREEPGVGCVRMSGSGATCFGVFDGPGEAAAAAGRLRTTHPGWWVRAVRAG